jgi:hypothetical protein
LFLRLVRGLAGRVSLRLGRRLKVASTSIGLKINRMNLNAPEVHGGQAKNSEIYTVAYTLSHF